MTIKRELNTAIVAIWLSNNLLLDSTEARPSVSNMTIVLSPYVTKFIHFSNIDKSVIKSFDFKIFMKN
ncbi:hypothetical protein BpHYR1_021691 [Brachionus plicatilis]|uniref:Uncharacterized protein n=1 Tax=Brachionus plicatilis TaxID=10195 RepID=A0A3M7QGB4_BRAPC|nr:hypothetical protein BpHYR1_021691 [Brachionus plicatilis]